MLRVIKALRPRWVLGENVANIVNMALDNVLSDLESEGYETATFVIPACAVGAPHRRDRVWIVAHSAGVERQSGTKEQGALRRVFAHQQKLYNADGPGEAQSGQDVADTCGKRLPESEQKRQFQIPATECGWGEAQSRLGRDFTRLPSWLDGHRWPAPYGCEQYEWEPPRVTTEKVPYRRQRLQASGNAVVPQIVEILGMAMFVVEEQGEYVC